MNKIFNHNGSVLFQTSENRIRIVANDSGAESILAEFSKTNKEEAVDLYLQMLDVLWIAEVFNRI